MSATPESLPPSPDDPTALTILSDALWTLQVTLAVFILILGGGLVGLALITAQ